jgi:hypothetical protein
MKREVKPARKWSDERLNEIVSKIPCDIACRDNASAQSLRSALYKYKGFEEKDKFVIRVRGKIVNIVEVEDPVIKIEEIFK